MKKLTAFVIVSASLFYSGCSKPTVTTELLRDNHFETGFNLLSGTHGHRSIIGTLNFDGKTKPQWDLAQWFSKYTLCGAQPEIIADGATKYKDESKYIVIGKPGSEYGDITLGLDSRPEWQGQMRRPDQPWWPHLLVDQPINRYVSLAEMKELRVHIEAKLRYDESFEMTGFDKEMHTAHILEVLVVQNWNKSSKGCGDFLWFLVPVYDTRYTEVPEWISADIVDPSAKMIYTPSSRTFGDYNLHDKQWHTIDADVLPLIKEAIKVSRQKGYLKDSGDLRDYSVTSVNLGWELPGINNAAIQIRNLSLKAVTPINKCTK